MLWMFLEDYIKGFNVPFPLPEKTDIEIRALASTGSKISSTFDVILVENDFVESRSSY